MNSHEVGHLHLLLCRILPQEMLKVHFADSFEALSP